MVMWSHRPGVPYYPPKRESDPMTVDQIKHMANRFLMWKLPEPFNPDNGIKFMPSAQWHADGRASPHWPIGTNLFDATQAEEMVRHMIEGLVFDATPRIDPAKMVALEAYIAVREMGKNPDMSPYQVTHAEIMAFLNGWDARQGNATEVAK